jgi:hypothetical protein
MVMLRNAWLLLAVGGLLGTPARVWAEDAYMIKTKQSGKGDTRQVDNRDTTEKKAKVEGPDGKALENKEEIKTSTEAYRENILERPDANEKATRLRRHYTRARVRTGGTERTLPYEGKTVLIEKKAGKYHFTIEGGGGDLTGRDAEKLDMEFAKHDSGDSLEQALLPRKAVRINETWKIDPKPLLEELDPFEADKDKVVGTGKLLRAYKKDGKQFGVLEFRVEVPLKGTFRAGDDKVQVQPGSKVVFAMKTDRCIDGTANEFAADAAMHMDLNGVLKGPDGTDYKMIISVKVTRKGNEKEGKKP